MARAKYRIEDAFKHKELSLTDKIEIVGINHKEELYNLKYIHDGLCGGDVFYMFDLPFAEVDEMYEKVEELLTYAEKQLVLYTKSHFVRGETAEDLKAFAGRQYALEIAQVQGYSLYHFVVDTFFKLLENGYINPKIHQFIIGLFKTADHKLDYLGMIEKMMSEISVVKAEGLNLGKADSSLLPTKESQKAQAKVKA